MNKFTTYQEKEVVRQQGHFLSHDALKLDIKNGLIDP